jgi:2-iminobutanoate/2-iminopropanoate deaminase
MKEVRHPDAWHSGRPYSPAVEVGGWLYVSGHVPVTATGDTAGANGKEQAAQVLKNMQATLRAGGATLSDIVSTTVYLTDMADIAAVDEVYRETFGPGPHPSRTTVQISSLGRPDFHVEISAVARVSGAGRP